MAPWVHAGLCSPVQGEGRLLEGVLLNSGSAAHCLKANTLETSVGRKGKVALFRRPAVWGEGGLMSKSQLPTADQEVKDSKGEFQGCTGGTRGLRAEQHSQLLQSS